jgi:hypothetical protein
MPVYLFTFHAYRSWNPDHPRGYVRRDEGVLPRDPEMAGRDDRHARHPPVRFDREIQRILVEEAQDICNRRDWRLHQIATGVSHVHVLVSWQEEALSWKDVHDTFKRVRDREHFEYLMTEYLPSHRGQAWSERDA